MEICSLLRSAKEKVASTAHDTKMAILTLLAARSPQKDARETAFSVAN